jgi:two-component system, NarL family, sensor histidine kinase UhpB
MIASNMATSAETNVTNILHLEDSELDHRLTKRVLTQNGFTFSIDRIDNLASFCELATGHNYDVILADYNLAGFTAIDAWNILTKKLASPPPFILLSGTIGETAAVEAIHLGISDYLHKNELSSLPRVIQRALDIQAANLAKDMAHAELAASEKRLSEFSDYLQSAIERERATIAREIHDDIGGSLAAVKLDLAWIARHNTDAATHIHVSAAIEMLQHALGASQRIMMDLRPAILDQGLVAAIQWLALSFEKRTGIPTALHANNEQLSPPKPVQLAAYRTAQESLTNISKYANCSRVLIDLSDAEDVLTLEIRDNGQGLSEQDLQKSRSFGIRGLHERARLVGGWLDVSSRKDHGTSIILSVPLSGNGHNIHLESLK